IGISCELPVETIEEGSITIPAKRLSDIVKEMPSGEISIQARKNNQIDIEGTNCRFKLNGLSKDEFPKFPEFKDKEAYSIPAETLKDMLRLTAFAVSHEESRYVLNGVYMEISDRIIRMVATDGRRLAKIEKKIASGPKKDISVIIPIKAVQEILRNLEVEGDVSFIIGSNQVLFDINGVLIATRIIEGDFPNYQQVVPKPIKTRISMKTKDFLSSIRRANLLATPDFQAVKFEVFQEKLVVSKSTPDIGESREEIPINYNGSEIVVGFNPQFLIDFLKNIDQDDIHLELLGVDKPAVIRLEEYLYLALPMRI
ncbi:MAG: DNA polymerase III subunit beta, partial [Candidatus Omnitrophica bacterium]|nr:DNA polymerase III subunit beta [Candidatus Omnitrophota bacterium]